MTDFGGFLEWLHEALWQQIQEVTGTTDATDLIEEDISAR